MYEYAISFSLLDIFHVYHQIFLSSSVLNNGKTILLATAFVPKNFIKRISQDKVLKDTFLLPSLLFEKKPVKYFGTTHFSHYLLNEATGNDVETKQHSALSRISVLSHCNLVQTHCELALITVPFHCCDSNAPVPKSTYQKTVPNSTFGLLNLGTSSSPVFYALSFEHQNTISVNYSAKYI